MQVRQKIAGGTEYEGLLARLRQLPALVQMALEVRQKFGRSLVGQLIDVLQLRRPPMRLGVGDYFDYRLFDDASFDFAAKRQFVGWAGEEELDILNAPDWHAMCDDKLQFHLAMRAARIPVPPLLAVYHEAGAKFDGFPIFTRPSDLADHLRHGIAYPFFAKPIHAGFGEGCVLATHYDPERDVICLDGEGGEAVAMPDFVGELRQRKHRGYLFQPVLSPHPELARICCGRLSTARVMVLWSECGPEIYRVYWKIPRGASIVDTFRKGASGTMLGQVDAITGRVLRVVQGYGLRRVEMDDHPDSGERMVGLTLPEWEQAKTSVLAAARAVPGLRFQHWDMALSASGPVALEVNLFSGGGTEPSQIVFETGLLEPRLLALCRSARNEAERAK